jgi:hypothetical protein
MGCEGVLLVEPLGVGVVGVEPVAFVIIVIITLNTPLKNSLFIKAY